ncbi:MAG: glycosyltransferase family 2 protein [Gemmatimonadales bacterium]
MLLPVFNEAGNLPPLLEELAAAIRPTGAAVEVIVVDDGSTDETATAAARAGGLPAQVVSHERNLGLARAIATGLGAILPQAADADVVVTMDADNTHPPSLIPAMLAEIRRGADLVIASRYVPGGLEEGVPPLRRLLSHGVGLLLRVRFGLRGVRDYSCGYRAYRTGLLRAAAARYGARLIESRGFTVMAELLLKLAPFHPVTVEVPLHLRYDRKQGASKMRLGQTIGGYLGLLLTRLPPQEKAP